MKDRHRTLVLVAAVALCGSAAYLPTVASGWVWDDVNLVQPSPALRDFSGLRRAVATDLYRQAAPRLDSALPLRAGQHLDAFVAALASQVPTCPDGSTSCVDPQSHDRLNHGRSRRAARARRAIAWNAYYGAK